MKSVEKVFAIFELLCERGEARLSDISKDTGLKVSTLHGMLATLIDMGYVKQNSLTKFYAATMKAFHLGLKVRDQTSLVALSRPYMLELRHQTGQTVNLSILTGGQTLVVERIEGDNNLTIINPGRALPAYATSSGKVMLADLSDDEFKDYLAQNELKPLTNQTITNPIKLKAELEKIRRLGYATEFRELIEGGMCLGAPIRDHTNKVVAATSLSVSYPSISKEKMMNFK
ncbi:MAG: IclR family transcriptional regulator, partial [Deltaproteobacteria bacterium]|nr:IclR family transcriptional regulator [Deltaproteobacteria bacterium]